MEVCGFCGTPIKFYRYIGKGVWLSTEPLSALRVTQAEVSAVHVEMAENKKLPETQRHYTALHQHRP